MLNYISSDVEVVEPCYYENNECKQYPNKSNEGFCIMSENKTKCYPRPPKCSDFQG